MSELLPIHVRSRRLSVDASVLELAWLGAHGRRTEDISSPKQIDLFLQVVPVGGVHSPTGQVSFVHLPDLPIRLREFLLRDAAPLVLLAALNTPAELDAAMDAFRRAATP